jgi:hypothetical protein
MNQTRLLLTAAFLILGIAANGQKVKPRSLMCIHEIEITLEDNMTFEQFEKLYQEEYIPAIEKNFQGVEVRLMKGERGQRTGKYIEVAFFDSLEHRNKWFPEGGKSTDEAKKAFDNMQEIQDRMMKMINSTYTDYVVL